MRDKRGVLLPVRRWSSAAAITRLSSGSPPAFPLSASTATTIAGSNFRELWCMLASSAGL